MRFQLPQVYKTKIVPEAEGSILEIGDYIFAGSPQNARMVLNAIRTAIRSLETFPQRFSIFEASSDPIEVVRFMPVLTFVVYYRVFETERLVEVLSVRRGARDRPPRFFR